MFIARVPGFGLVEWNAQQVKDYAHELIHTHRPERLTIVWRGWSIFRLPFVTQNACKRCTEPWPYPSAWWADRYQHSHAQEMTSTSAAGTAG